VDLTSKLGSVEIIDPKAAANVGGAGNGVTKCSDGVGWHCRVCDCFLKDSLTYLDHINGRKHQRYLGYSMRVEKSTAEDVGGVLKGLAQKKNEDNGDNVVESVDFEEVILKREEDAARRKKERAKRREERKRRARGEGVADDGEKNGDDSANDNPADDNTTNDNPANDNPTNETANDADAVDEVEEEEDDGVMDPNLAAMMGFSGFGGSRKK
jgi:U4/U6.U5 tri-snRNP component SNU23